jgi:hypothetical protein
MVRKLSLKSDAISEQKNEFVENVEKSLKTPVSLIKYCFLSKPFFYSGSHVPRYSITLLFDKNLKEEKEFLESLEKIATKSNVSTIGFIEDGLISIKFQGKDQPQFFILEKGKKKPELIELEHDLPEGFKASVEFELNTYFNKVSQKKAFNFSPKKVTFHMENGDLQLTGDEKNGNNKSSRNRPRLADNGIRDSKLSPRKKRSVGK